MGIVIFDFPHLRRISFTRLKKIIGESSWLVGGQLLLIECMLVLIKVVTENVQSEIYGKFTLRITLGTLISQVALSGVMLGIIRFYLIAFEKT